MVRSKSVMPVTAASGHACASKHSSTFRLIRGYYANITADVWLEWPSASCVAHGLPFIYSTHGYIQQ